MDIKPIKTDTDYRAALKEVETLMTAKPEKVAAFELYAFWPPLRLFIWHLLTLRM
nr:hypothetical protein [Nitrosomonas communis]